MSTKKNCWEFTCCGREPGGNNVHELGICPAAIAKSCDGIHGGVCGGRSCWAISGTLCNGKLQGTIASKFKNCIKCEFYQTVLAEESASGLFLTADQIISCYHPDELATQEQTDSAHRNAFSALIRAEDATLNTQLRQFLERKSIHVIEASTTQEVIAHASQAHPDIILLTLTLPALEGLTSCAAIRQLDSSRDIPVIFITTSENRLLESQGFKLGALAVVPSIQSTFWEELDQRIERVMRLKRSMNGLAALVIDTNPISRRITTACLEQQGVTVRYADTSEQAKAISMSGEAVDLVLTEVNAAGVDGLDLCRFLRRQPAFTATTIILLCPEQYRPKVLEFFQAGATDYIIKPCPREELLARLLIHIESQQRLKELAQEVDKNKLLLNSVGEGIVGIDLHGHVTFVNQAASRMLGYLPAELLGNNLHGMVHHTLRQGEPYSSLDCPIQQSLEHGKIISNFDDIFWRSDNTSLPVKYVSTPILANDAIQGAVVAFSDITTQKREEALRQDIERITRHDLKTPLNGIISIPQLLMEDDNLTERQRVFLEMLKDSGHRMLEMIDESLNLFKMEKGTYQFTPVRVDLLASIRSVTSELALLQQKRIALTICVEGVSNSEDQKFLVLGEELLCYSMFANLLKNAAEASPDSGEITIHLNRKGQFADIVIHNQGVVPKEIRERFFEKYTTAGKSDGTGLGTYSAKLMAETQQGGIGMTSDSEAGTSIYIKLLTAPWE